MTVFLEQLSRPLLVLHGLLAGGVVGLLTHHAVWAFRARAERPRLRRQARFFIRLGTALTALQLLLGLLIYPTYRVRVRMAHFDLLIDGRAPLHWVSGLFDLKEHSASLLLAVCIALLFTDRLQDEVFAGRFPEPGRTLHLGLSLVAALLAWLVTSVGLWVASYRGLPVGGV